MRKKHLFLTPLACFLDLHRVHEVAVDLVVNRKSVPPPREGFALGWGYLDTSVKFTVSVEDLRAHVLIAGSTGSGKTTTAKKLLTEVSERGYNWLLLDWHGEYQDIADTYDALYLDPNAGDLRLNPLDRIRPCDLAEHVSTLTDIFAMIFKFTPAQAFMFREAVYKAYTESRTGLVFLSDVVKRIEDRDKIRSIWDYETKQALLRRLKPLTEGEAARILDGPSTVTMRMLFSTRTCINLRYIASHTVKKLLMLLLLKRMYDYCLTGGRTLGAKDTFFTVIEEARAIFSRKYELISEMLVQMVAELRKFGVSLVLISQAVSDLPLDIIRNTNLKICHALKERNDIECIASSVPMLLSQRKLLPGLPAGVALVHVAGNLSSSMVHVEMPKLRHKHRKRLLLGAPLCEVYRIVKKAYPAPSVALYRIVSSKLGLDSELAKLAVDEVLKRIERR